MSLYNLTDIDSDSDSAYGGLDFSFIKKDEKDKIEINCSMKELLEKIQNVNKLEKRIKELENENKQIYIKQNELLKTMIKRKEDYDKLETDYDKLEKDYALLELANYYLKPKEIEKYYENIPNVSILLELKTINYLITLFSTDIETSYYEIMEIFIKYKLKNSKENFNRIICTYLFFSHYVQILNPTLYFKNIVKGFILANFIYQVLTLLSNFNFTEEDNNIQDNLINNRISLIYKNHLDKIKLIDLNFFSDLTFKCFNDIRKKEEGEDSDDCDDERIELEVKRSTYSFEKKYIKSYNLEENDIFKINIDNYFEEEKENKEEYIYIVTNKIYESQDIFKIGRTKNLDNRLSAYQSGRTKEDLFYYKCCVPTNYSTIFENVLKQLLKPHQNRGELYNLPYEKLFFILHQVDNLIYGTYEYYDQVKYTYKKNSIKKYKSYIQ